MSTVIMQEVQSDQIAGQARSFLSLLRVRDPYTGVHSDRLLELASKICEVFGLGPADTQTIEAGAYLHDIGKIAIPDDILRKPGRLSADEWEIMQTHSALGAAALREMPEFRHLAPIVLHHHARYDGAGYPSRLAGENIPFGSRVIGVLDAYDAMTTDRAYCTAQTMGAAGMELLAGKGTQFDPDVVDALLEVVGYRVQLH